MGFTFAYVFGSDHDKVSASKAPCECLDPLRFVTAVDQFLGFFARHVRSYDDLRVSSFEVQCCLGPAFSEHINRWVDFAVRDLRVEKVFLAFLSKLLMRDCTLTRCLLKTLGISFCPGIKELCMSNNANLTMLVCRCRGIVWDFCGAPNLRKLVAAIDANMGCLANHLTPSLFKLHVFFYSMQFQRIPDNMPIFSSVTRLSLYLKRSVKFETVRMVSTMKAFPNLARLSLGVDHAEDFEDEEIQPCTHVIQHLKEVKMLRFRATSGVIEFTIYFLKHVIGLKRLILQTCSTSPSGLKSGKNGDLQKFFAIQEFSNKGVDIVIAKVS
ncbi:hypothetical protein AKJ16_DCAP18258 [Drosera capensis]